MPTGLSLHIGLNRYDTRAYRQQGLEITNLPNCCQDAAAKCEIAKEHKFNTAMLLDKEATINNVLTGINEAARRLYDGDIFFLSFSGHGYWVNDLNGDETDKRDETWCLYDGMVIDDELFERWKLFRPGVRIVIIADSCHSGTSAKDVKKAREQFTLAEKSGDVQASCLLLSACQDGQVAQPGANLKNSLFTYWLLKVLNSRETCDSYRELHYRVTDCMPANSKPNLFLFGPGAEQLVKQRPFRI